jgi:hypothetical protein
MEEGDRKVERKKDREDCCEEEGAVRVEISSESSKARMSGQ